MRTVDEPCVPLAGDVTPGCLVFLPESMTVSVVVDDVSALVVRDLHRLQAENPFYYAVYMGKLYTIGKRIGGRAYATVACKDHTLDLRKFRLRIICDRHLYELVANK